MKEKYRNIVLVAPDPESFISGGNIYNLHFLKAIRTFDPAVGWMNFKAFQALSETDKQDLYLLDTFYFEALKSYDGDLSASFLLVHLLESLNQKEADRLDYFRREEAAVLDRFKGFVSTSHFTKSYLCSLGYEKSKHITLPPAIAFQPIRKEKPTEKVQALMVNNLMERKGIIALLMAIKNSRISAKRFQLTIIGNDTIEPEYAEKVKAILEDEKIGGMVEYIGVLPHEQVKKYYQTANLYLSSAYMETFGISLQEAVAYRIPVLAYDGGSANYHIEEGRNGFLFKSIANLVNKLEDLCFDVDEFQNVVDGAWQFRKFENYTWNMVVKKFVNQLCVVA